MIIFLVWGKAEKPHLQLFITLRRLQYPQYETSASFTKISDFATISIEFNINSRNIQGQSLLQKAADGGEKVAGSDQAGFPDTAIVAFGAIITKVTIVRLSRELKSL